MYMSCMTFQKEANTLLMSVFIHYNSSPTTVFHECELTGMCDNPSPYNIEYCSSTSNNMRIIYHSCILLDDLDSAFKIASADVGKDWASLYKKLPFLPLRDFKERSRDLEGKLNVGKSMQCCVNTLH